MDTASCFSAVLQMEITFDFLFTSLDAVLFTDGVYF